MLKIKNHILLTATFLVFVLVAVKSNEINTTESNYSVNISEGNFSLLYNNKPGREFIFDAPHTIKFGNTIPVLIMIKDSNDNPYSFYKIEIFDAKSGNNRLIKTLYLSDLKLPINGFCFGSPYTTITQYLWYTIIYLDQNLFIKDSNNYIYIDAKIDGVGNIFCSHYDSDFSPNNGNIKIKIVDDVLPKIPNWYCGDTHFHSFYTDNILEFGAPIEAVKVAGKAVGLDWITITDHSSDLDDNLNVWDNLKSDANYYSDSSFKIMVGEEIDCGEDLLLSHLLAYNISNYLVGDFWPDPGGKSSGFNTCEYNINLINSKGGFAFPAHPYDPIPWREWELNFTGLEIWNGKDKICELEKGLEKWIELLLNGKKIFIEAGSDAHGDFQKIGEVQTCCYSPAPISSPDFEKNIMNSLKNGQCYITDNGALKFEISTPYDSQVLMGESTTIKNGDPITIKIDYNPINPCQLLVFKGEIGGSEKKLKNLGLVTYPSSSEFTTFTTNNSYYRVQCNDSSKNWRMYTNPIWVNVIQPATTTIKTTSTTTRITTTLPTTTTTVDNLLTTFGLIVNRTQKFINKGYYSSLHITGSDTLSMNLSKDVENNESSLIEVTSDKVMVVLIDTVLQFFGLPPVGFSYSFIINLIPSEVRHSMTNYLFNIQTLNDGCCLNDAELSSKGIITIYIGNPENNKFSDELNQELKMKGLPYLEKQNGAWVIKGERTYSGNSFGIIASIPQEKSWNSQTLSNRWGNDTVRLYKTFISGTDNEGLKVAAKWYNDQLELIKNSLGAFLSGIENFDLQDTAGSTINVDSIVAKFLGDYIKDPKRYISTYTLFQGWVLNIISLIQTPAIGQVDSAGYVVIVNKVGDSYEVLETYTIIGNNVQKFIENYNPPTTTKTSTTVTSTLCTPQCLRWLKPGACLEWNQCLNPTTTTTQSITTTQKTIISTTKTQSTIPTTTCQRSCTLWFRGTCITWGDCQTETTTTKIVSTSTVPSQTTTFSTTTQFLTITTTNKTTSTISTTTTCQRSCTLWFRGTCMSWVGC